MTENIVGIIACTAIVIVGLILRYKSGIKGG
jgi:hypothetical protein